MQRVVMLLDMDYFFAQVEERGEPELKGKPLMVCIFSGRGEFGGVVSTCNYEARRLGVHSGMPIAFAKKRAKDGVFLPASFEKYEKASERIMQIVKKYAKNTQQASIDEAYAELTQECNGDFSKAEEVAQKIKNEILQKEKLTCSVGIGENKLIAKMAAEVKKPDGLSVVKPQETGKFLQEMEVGKLFGVGKKTEEKLHALGIKTIGELANADLLFLTENFGNSFGKYLFDASKGKDDEPVKEREEAGQISRIASFPKDTEDREEIVEFVSKLAKSVFERAREENVEFRQVTFTAILEGLEAHTKSRTFEKYESSLEVLQKTAMELAHEFDLRGKKIRRAGVRVGMLRKKGAAGKETGNSGRKAAGETAGNQNGTDNKRDAKQKNLFDF